MLPSLVRPSSLTLGEVACRKPSLLVRPSSLTLGEVA